MDNVRFALDAGWKVLLAGLMLGAGLPALFAAGIRFLAWGTGGAAEVGPAPHGAAPDRPRAGRRVFPRGRWPGSRWASPTSWRRALGRP